MDALKGRGAFSPTRRNVIVLDGHTSNVTLDVIVKAKQHGVDLSTLPSYTSHELEPLDVACFRSFKQTFRAYRNVWSITNPNGRCRKEDLIQWIFLALKRVLTPSNIKAKFRRCGS